MAVAHPPLVDRERKEVSPIPNAVAVETKKSISPVLIVLLAAMAAFPFIVGYLPESVRQYLGALFR